MTPAGMPQPLQPQRLIFAGIDIGTLTCRLLIAEILNAGRLHELFSDRRILRLGQGVDRDRRLAAEAMDRVIATLQEWRKVIDRNEVVACAAVATSAVRDAQNSAEFLDRVKREAGLEVEVITGEEEARRILLGIRSGLAAGVAGILALDIGGGSTEFILDQPGRPPIVRSIDIGVVRLSERILQHDAPTEEEIRQAREWIRKNTASAMTDMSRAIGLAFVGTAGTITSLAAMAQKLPAYEPACIHNYRLKRDTVMRLEQELLSRTSTEREGMPGLERGREEVIAAGAVILRTVMEMLEQDEVLVSDFGLREGVVIDLAKRMGNDERGDQ